MPQRNWNDIPDLLKPMPMKVYVKDGTIYNYTTMGKRLERFGEARVVAEMNDFGLDFVKKRKSGFWRHVVYL